MIGASSSYGSPNGIRVPFQGYMSDVRVYDRALLSNEVASLYAIESGVPQLLQLTSQPRDVQLSDTNTQAATFTVVATNGVAPISYQWMKDGVALTNQTNTSLILSNAGANTVGYYSCQVTDANINSVISSNAALNITSVPFWLWQGLVAYYPFNGNANDIAGLNNGQVYGATLTEDRFGDPNSAYYFSDNAYINLGGGSALQMGTSDYTLAAWIKCKQYDPDIYIISRYETYDPGYGLGTGQNGGPYAFLGDGVHFSEFRGGIDLNDGVWHSIVATFKRDNQLRLYLDGILILNNNSGNFGIDITSINSDIESSVSCYIGKQEGGRSFIGSIDDVRIYNRALSSNEVSALYSLESTPPGPTNPQSITFPSIPTLTLTNGAYSLGATASSGLPVTYSIGDAKVAGITNGTLMPLGIGTTTVVASQAGDGTNWMTATPVTNPLIVTLAQQSFTPTPIAGELYGSLPVGLTLPTNASGLPITARIVSGPASLSGTNLILSGTGTVTVAYDAPGNALYAAASVTNTFSVTNGPTNLRSQTITFKPLPAMTYGQKPLLPSASASSKLPLSFWSSNTNVAVISGTNLVVTGAGQSVITAYQPGDGSTWKPAAPVSQTLIVNQASQKLTFRTVGTRPYGTAPVALTASSSAGLPVSFTSSDPTVATLATRGTNTLLTPVGTGTVTLTALQAGNANVSAATPISQSVVISQGSQTITFPTIGTNATSVTQVTVPGNTHHTIVIGSSNTVVSISSGNGPMTISSSPTSTATYAPGLSLALAATSSAGLPVSYSCSPANVASVSGSTMTILSAGALKVTASQPGNSLWAAAKPVNQSLTVAKALQTISFPTPSPIAYASGGVVTLTATSSSGLPVSFSSSNPKALTVAGTTALITGKGTAKITATQSGNGSYSPAPSVSVTVTVQ